MQAFDTTAKYYEVLTNRVKRLEREGPFLLDCLAHAPGTRVLDLACGTGLHAEFLAGSGARVTAIDASAAMVAHAQSVRSHPGVEYRVGDMRQVEGGPWDMALCVGNSLSLLPDDADLGRVLGGVRRSLVAGGILVIQVLNYLAPGMDEPRHRVERAVDGDTQVVAVKNLVPESGRTLLALSFFALTGECTQSACETAVLRHWSPAHLHDAAVEAGFDVVEQFGSYDFTPFAPDLSTDCLIRCR